MRGKALLIILIMLMVPFSGCLNFDEDEKIIPNEEVYSNGLFTTNSKGTGIDVPPIVLDFFFSNVGEDGPEPSIGITSTGSVSYTHLRAHET